MSHGSRMIRCFNLKFCPEIHPLTQQRTLSLFTAKPYPLIDVFKLAGSDCKIKCRDAVNSSESGDERQVATRVTELSKS